MVDRSHAGVLPHCTVYVAIPHWHCDSGTVDGSADWLALTHAVCSFNHTLSVAFPLQLLKCDTCLNIHTQTHTRQQHHHAVLLRHEQHFQKLQQNHTQTNTFVCACAREYVCACVCECVMCVSACFCSSQWNPGLPVWFG